MSALTLALFNKLEEQPARERNDLEAITECLGTISYRSTVKPGMSAAQCVSNPYIALALAAYGSTQLRSLLTATELARLDNLSNVMQTKLEKTPWRAPAVIPLNGVMSWVRYNYGG